MRKSALSLTLMMIFTMKLMIFQIYLFNEVFTSPYRQTKYLYLKEAKRYPIILIHGIGGTQAHCRLRDSESHTKRFIVWIRVLYFLLPEKLLSYMGLSYNPTSKTTHERGICDVEFPGFGDTWASEYLTEEKYALSSYMKQLVDGLAEDRYFVRNKTIRAAPYDFRRSPNENAKYFDKLKQLVEETYRNGDNRPVYLLGHSLGSLYSMYFLKRQTKDWKKKYVKGFISVSGPFGGSVEALYAEACGDNFGIPLRSTLAFREVERSFPAMAFLLPDPRLWPDDEKIIITANKNYSAFDMKEFFDDISFPSGYEMMQAAKQSIDTFEQPTDVEIYCIYSIQMPTISQMIFMPSGKFRSTFPNQIPRIKYGDGDGMVGTRSLSVCNNWKSINLFILKRSTHEDILKDVRLIRYVKKVVTSD